MKKIALTQGLFATIDDEDFELVSGFKWCAHKNRNVFYARTNVRLPNGNRTTLQMHRVILQAAPGLQADHNKNPRSKLRGIPPLP